jgi:hypothetical protein
MRTDFRSLTRSIEARTRLSSRRMRRYDGEYDEDCAPYGGYYRSDYDW